MGVSAGPTDLRGVKGKAYASKIPCDFARNAASSCSKAGDTPSGKTKNDKRQKDLGKTQEPDPSEASWRGLIRGVNTESRVHLGNAKR